VVLLPEIQHRNSYQRKDLEVPGEYVQPKENTGGLTAHSKFRTLQTPTQSETS